MIIQMLSIYSHFSIVQSSTDKTIKIIGDQLRRNPSQKLTPKDLSRGLDVSSIVTGSNVLINVGQN